jgi:hypothetical protein
MWVQHAACTGKNRRCIHAFGNVHSETLYHSGMELSPAIGAV